MLVKRGKNLIGNLSINEIYNKKGFTMIIPIRCFSCGKVIGSLYEEFKRRVDAGEKSNEVMDNLKINRYCCRRMLLSHTDLIDEVMPYG